MNEAVKGAKDLYNNNVGSTNSITPNSLTFYLIGKVSVAMLFLFFFLTASNQFFGDVIDCSLDETEPTVFNFEKYCLSKSTYTMDSNKATDVINKVLQDYSIEAINNGLYYKNSTWYLKSNGRPVKLHQAYRWIYLGFLLQALVFYIPTLIWKVFGQKKLLHLLKMVDDKEKLLKHLINTRNKNRYLGCSLFFTFCEVLNLICVIGQFTAVNYFWTESVHGLDLIKWIWTNPNHQDEVMDMFFPFETKCLIFHIGPSGTYQRLGGRCLLHFNPIYHKMFTFLWLWSAFLIVISILNLFYRFFIMTSVPSVRIESLRSKAPSVPFKKVVLAVGEKCFYGDWFMFQFLADYMDEIDFNELIDDLTSDRFILQLPV